jgi:hypothetical protein
MEQRDLSSLLTPEGSYKALLVLLAFTLVAAVAFLLLFTSAGPFL